MRQSAHPALRPEASPPPPRKQKGKGKEKPVVEETLEAEEELEGEPDDVNGEEASAREGLAPKKKGRPKKVFSSLTRSRIVTQNSS